jgi:four helix bundle protein
MSDDNAERKPPVRRFEDLIAWQRARSLAHRIYQISAAGSFSRDFAMRDQLRRAVISIGANVAEGFERGGDREFGQFLAHAKGSAGEVRALLYVALDAGYLSQQQFDDLAGQVRATSAVIAGLMRYLQESELRGSKYRHRTDSGPDSLRELPSNYIVPTESESLDLGPWTLDESGG